MVRDDFWLATTRFLGELEIDLLQGQNTAVVDLFDVDHARKVLAALGRVWGKLAENPGETTREQKEFLKQAVAGLAQDGKVICVRLALFAEMIKGKPWVPATLKAVGGMEGVGVNFLEETFASPAANPKHRLHQNAARAVLRALLPETGMDIKGTMRSQKELIAASGYVGRPKEFAELIRILDRETRLITPTDPEGTLQGDHTPSEFHVDERYYQLTHDYLVHSLRDWLTRKQKESWRGRAELRLAERAALWITKPQKRNLPRWYEWANLRLLTAKKDWTASQRAMMASAASYHAVRGSLLTVCVVALAYFSWDGWGRLKAHHLRDRLLEAAIVNVPGIIDEMAHYRRWTDPILRETLASAEQIDSRERVHASLALLLHDPNQVPFLSAKLLTAESHDFAVLRDSLRDYKEVLVPDLWATADDPKMDEERRFRAACALAEYDRENQRWKELSRDVTAKLIRETPDEIGSWIEALRPVGRSFLLPALADILADERRSDAERSVATSLFANYAQADPEPFATLEQRLTREEAPTLEDDDKKLAAKRRANVAVALVQMGQFARAQRQFEHTSDPTVRTYLIHKLGPPRISARIIVSALEDSTRAASIRQALILSLAGFDLEWMPATNSEYSEIAARESQTGERISAGQLRLLTDTYRQDPDPGVHAATEWLLRHWRQEDALRKIDAQLEQQDRPIASMGSAPADGRNWYVNSQRQTMMIVRPTGEFWMDEGEQRHKRQLRRAFAIASKEVTVEQFRKFSAEHEFAKVFAPTKDCPVNNITWYDAAAYCNWLSARDNIDPSEWCYQPNDKGKYAAGMTIVPDTRAPIGYRLPTYTEWEAACRAGSVTKFSFGDAEEMAERYAWHSLNANGTSHPVGLLKPNPLGLFDMHGNAWEWCQGRFQSYKEAAGIGPLKELPDIVMVNDQDTRALRGGYFSCELRNLRSADVSWLPASTRLQFGSFRPARTIR
jgi:formylglycine-generating enzyme required for sulfatase activity